MSSRVFPKLTDRLPLGSRGLEVSPVCIGLVQDPAVIPAAFEAGINFFFITADMHWPLYEQTRRGLRDLLAANPAARDSIVVAATAYVTQPEFCWYPFEEVLAEVPPLQRIDVTVAGGSYGHEIPTRLPVFERHLRTGHVGARAIGASFHDRASARELIGRNAFDIAFVRYNSLHPGARSDLFAHLAGRDAGRTTLVYNFKSTDGFLRKEDSYRALGIGDDYWRPEITDYYRFVLAEPALDGLLCAMPAPFAIGELADALARGPLNDEDYQYLLDLGELVLGNATLATKASG